MTDIPQDPVTETPPEGAIDTELSPETAAAPPQSSGTAASGDQIGRDSVVSNGGDAKVENITNNFYRSRIALARYAAEHGTVDRDLKGIVDPPDGREHLRALGATRVLVLTGPSHSGLPTAASCRWVQFAKGAGDLPLRVLHPDNRDDLQTLVDQSEPGTVQLLDSSSDSELGRDIVELLPRFQAAMRDRGSYLVIAVGDQCHSRAIASLPGSVFALGKPDQRLVLATYLRKDIAIAPLLANERFKAMLAECWPPRVEKLAAIINDAGPDADVDELVDGLDAFVEDWSGELELLVEAFEPDTRALLVAAAAMEGASAGAVALAADWFMDIVGFEGPHRDMLRMRLLAQRFEPLKEVFRIEGAGTAFTESGYGEAVLPVLWEQFPSWREPMREWFDRLLLPSSYLDDEPTARLLLRLLELASHLGDATLVLERASKLLSGRSTNYRQGLTTDLLIAAATDPSIGRQTRYQLWRWAKNWDDGSEALQRTVVATCASTEYTERYPDNAMRRLKHLVKSRDHKVHRQALEAVVDLGASMPTRSMFLHMSEWFSGDRGNRLRLAAPDMAVRLLGSDSVIARIRDRPGALEGAREFAVRFLQRLFASASSDQVRSVVTAWLALADKLDYPDREHAVAMLSAAAAEDILAIGQLAQAVSHGVWVDRPDADRRRPMLERLRADLSRMEVPLS
ncbi:hypothetical protein K3N28_19585 [Glycomyces sp. TRM65418]|uniref:hypothetical protein n=1 Tax=Glycomyces sp. TRM65418 TaxID=2867006 RepID=UPI001CE54C9C|nr:hypothetical protein [Glycomyces sp. TRM65418]MCC3765265.1 hypothetical protein [Glycomyces sp. TRM65418]QZD54886.1 hypothetical protein K3N28_19490 [Glycomyces sp. TRM65418]